MNKIKIVLFIPIILDSFLHDKKLEKAVAYAQRRNVMRRTPGRDERFLFKNKMLLKRI